MLSRVYPAMSLVCALTWASCAAPVDAPRGRGTGLRRPVPLSVPPGRNEETAQVPLSNGNLLIRNAQSLSETGPLQSNPVEVAGGPRLRLD